MKRYSIGFISHDEEVFNHYLGPSIKGLEGDFDVQYTSDECRPAHNYNEMIKDCNTPYLILTHQDVTFTKDLLERIDMTIAAVGEDFGALGLVGVTQPEEKKLYWWANVDTAIPVDTLDSCFIVVQVKNGPLFDEETFDDFHLYVEDYCATISHEPHNKGVYTILTEGGSIWRPQETMYLAHHSATINKVGNAWGFYDTYWDRFGRKWPGVRTT